MRCADVGYDGPSGNSVAQDCSSRSAAHAVTVQVCSHELSGAPNSLFEFNGSLRSKTTYGTGLWATCAPGRVPKPSRPGVRMSWVHVPDVYEDHARDAPRI
jgi:hypothetical protein